MTRYLLVLLIIGIVLSIGLTREAQAQQAVPAQIQTLLQQRQAAVDAGNAAAVMTIDKKIADLRAVTLTAPANSQQTVSALPSNTIPRRTVNGQTSPTVASSKNLDPQAQKEMAGLMEQWISATSSGNALEVVNITAKMAKVAEQSAARQAVANAKTGATGGGLDPNRNVAGTGGGGWQNSAAADSWNAVVASSDCKFCDMFADLDEIKNEWSVDLFRLIAPQITSALHGIVMLYILIMGLIMMTSFSNATAVFRKLGIGCVIIVIVLITLDVGTGTPWPWMVIREIETSALKLGALIISHTADKAVAIDQAGGLYAALTGLIEAQVWTILGIAGKIMAGDSSLSIFGVQEAIERAVTALIMILPYIFVLGIFLAFLVEAMFKFVSISMLSPLLMPALIFGWSRAYVFASLRILLGAFLTIVFASMAMGLTVKVVQSKMNDIDYIRKVSGDALGSATATAETFCTKAEGTDILIWDNRSEQEKINQKQCEMVWAEVTTIEEAKLALLGSEYFTIVILGFVSVLLHLQSKSLASNISGANDGAGPAAATVAGAKMLLGAGMMYGSRAVFGSGGPLGSIRDAIGSTKTGDTLQRRGLAGAAASGVTSAASSIFGGGGSDPNGLRSSDVLHSVFAPGGDAASNVAKTATDAATSASGVSEKKPGGLRE